MPKENEDLSLIKEWLKSGDQQKIADEKKLAKSIVSNVLRGVRTDSHGIIFRASEIALNRKKMHEATQANLKALA
jgi:hypothetical protein